MKLSYFDYLEPLTTDQGLQMLSERAGEVRLLAGGTDLLPRIRFRLVQPSCLLSLGSVAGLAWISEKDGLLRIGTMTTLTDLDQSNDVRRAFNALYEAVESVAAPPIRNIATVGGNLCQNSRCLFYNQSETWRKEKPPCCKAGGSVCLAVRGGKKCFSVYQGDLAPAIIACGGSIKVEKRGSSRIMPLEKLFSGNAEQPVALGNDEMITEVVLPVPEGRVGSSYRKLRMRSAVDYPLLSVAASISIDKQGRIDAARVVLGAAGPAPFIAREAGELLLGQDSLSIDLDNVGAAATWGAQMVDNLVLPAPYRRKMIPVFVRRAVEAAIQGAMEPVGKEGA